MDSTFGEQFGRSKGEPIQYQGKRVHCILCREVEGEVCLTIRFLGSRVHVPQALRVKSYNSTVLVEGQTLGDIELWADNYPSPLELRVLPTKKRKRLKEPSVPLLKVWNAWRDERGVTQAWIGNSGMLIEEVDGDTLLKCSDGVGPPDFTDLVVSLRFSPSAS